MVYKIYCVDTYIAEKTQWFIIYSAYSLSRVCYEGLQVYLSIMLGNQPVILEIYNNK